MPLQSHIQTFLYQANAVHCGASVSELYRVFIGSMVVTYILHVCICTMHNRNIYLYKFMHWQSGQSTQPYISALLIFLPLLGCFYRMSGSLSCFRVRSSLAVFVVLAAMVSELFCKYRMYMFTTSSKTMTIRRVHVFPIRSRAQCPYAVRVCVHCTGRTMYDKYIYQRNSAVQLTSVGRA